MSPSEAIEDAREALALARDTFCRYEDLHRAEGTTEGNEKANANAAMMLRMDEALAAILRAKAAP